MSDQVHLRADWCPVEGRIPEGPRGDGTCGLCGSPIVHTVAPGGGGVVTEDQPIQTSPGAVYSPQLKAAGRLKWPFIIMQVLLVIQIVLSALKLWVVSEWAAWDFEAAWGFAVIENYTALAFAASGITFVVWSFLAHSNLDTFGRHDQTHSHRATIWWWIAPLANLVMPYRVMYETVRGSQAPAGDPDWKNTRLPRTVAWWTGLFIAGMILNQIVFAFFDDAIWANDYTLFRTATFITEIVWIAAAILTIVMMTHVNRAQQRLAARWRGPLQYPFGGPARDRRPSSFLGPIDTNLNDDHGTPII